MALSRRQFVGLGGLVVASAFAPLEAASKSGAAGSPSFDAALEVPLQYMNAETFVPLVGQRFLAHTNAARPVVLTLTAVEEIKAPVHTAAIQHFGFGGRAASVAPSGPQTTTFALRFRGQPGKYLPQGSYTFESSTLGKFMLFTVPSGRGMRTPTCTAIISHVQR